MLSRWDLGSGELFFVEDRFVVLRYGIDAIPAIRIDCPTVQRGSVTEGRRLVTLLLVLGGALVDFELS